MTSSTSRARRRHESPAPPGYHFDRDDAQRAVDFFARRLRHVEGPWAGHPFLLEPWQHDIVWNVFGWKREDGRRRYTTVYVEIPRKNGKSTFGAGLALKLLTADNEFGAQVYGAAEDRDQATIIFRIAAAMVRQDRVLRERCEVIDSSKRIIVARTNSFYRAIPADAEGTHGINAHGVIFDELHTQPDRRLYDVLTTSQGAQRQPLTVFFTTAGFDKATICGEEHDRALKVASGVIDDPSYLPVIYAAGEEDDWEDPKTWRKANPSYDALGIAFQDDLARQARRAKDSPAFRNTFLRLHLNRWTRQQTTWLPMERWDATAGLVNLAEIAPDRHCTIAAWLASSTELATVIVLFPPEAEGGEYVVHMDTFAPADNIDALADRDQLPYRKWVEQGWLTLTEGDIIDFGRIRRQIIDRYARRYQVDEIACNPRGAVQFMQQLQAEDQNVVEVLPGFATMSPALNELERLVLGQRIRHGGNEILRAMVANLAVRHNPNGDLRPDREGSSGRIEGVTTLLMALGRAIVAESDVGAWAAS